MAITRWRIRKWEPGPCPEKAFREGGDLLIFQQEGSDACSLVWMSGEDEPELCWIELPLVPSEVPVPVYFGPQKSDHVVSVIRQGNTLLGTLKPETSNDGSAGTFGAEANGPMPE
ncbi:MAG TPA: hypothetical protein VF414_17755 [Thermoanaerobaculia bacterium]